MKQKIPENQFKLNIILSVIILIAIFFSAVNNVFFTNPSQYGIFPSQENDLKLNFEFKDNSHLLPLNKFSKNSFRGREPRYSIVADINNDSYEDLIFIAREGDSRKSTTLNVLINNNGTGFLNETKKWYFPPKNKAPSSAAVADLDNDGFEDLIVSYDNGEVFFFKNLKNSFSLNSFWKIYKSVGDKRSITLADFNNDGFLDVYFGSYLNIDPASIISTAYNSVEGGHNVLLINNRGNSFIDQTISLGVTDTRYTWTSAAVDFNNDGLIDIINANDFGKNTYLKNNGFGFVRLNNWHIEKTDSFNMSSEVTDLNNNGVPEIYISNTNKFPLLVGNNRLLEFQNDKFVNLASDLNMESCGWSWGAKSFDPELDNISALLVVTSPNWSENQTFRIHYFSTPFFIKKLFSNYLLNVFSSNFYNYETNQTQRYCVFYPKGKKYVDISKLIKTPIGEGGRSIAEFDYNLNGVSDFVISNSKKSPTLLEGVYKGKNKWITLNLQGTKSNRDAIGAIVRVKIDNKIITRFNLPTNGYHSQSSKYIKIGIPKKISEVEINIIWPSKIHQKVKINNFNKLYTIIESAASS
jgi:hypothetical protein